MLKAIFYHNYHITDIENMLKATFVVTCKRISFRNLHVTISTSVWNVLVLLKRYY